MARKVKDITITDENRDKGKHYRITEMPASQAERWAVRCLMGMVKSGTDIPSDIVYSGWVGLASFGVRALGGMNFSDAEPLLAEMMDCVKFVPDANNQHITRNIIEDDIEEITTRMMLRKEVFSLHVDFFTIAEKQASDIQT